MTNATFELHFLFEEQTAKPYFIKGAGLDKATRARFGDTLKAAKGRLAETIVCGQPSQPAKHYL